MKPQPWYIELENLIEELAAFTTAWRDDLDFGLPHQMDQVKKLEEFTTRAKEIVQ